MEPWVILILALLAVVILGGFSAGFLPAFWSNRFWSGPKRDDTIESKAARLHELVHPDEGKTGEPEQAERADREHVR